MDLNRGGSSSVFHGMIITRLRIYQKMRSSLLLSDVLPDGWSKSDWRERGKTEAQKLMNKGLREFIRERERENKGIWMRNRYTKTVKEAE